MNKLKGYRFINLKGGSAITYAEGVDRDDALKNAYKSIAEANGTVVEVDKKEIPSEKQSDSKDKKKIKNKTKDKK